MASLLHTEFAALLARVGVSQAAFARLAGVIPRQVNDWGRGHAAVPPWKVLLAVVLEGTTVEALLLMLGDAGPSRHQMLGVLPSADMATLRRTMRGPALLYHPDKGGEPEQMTVANQAYADAAQAASRDLYRDR